METNGNRPCTVIPATEQDESWDIKKILSLIWINRWWFFGSIVIMLAVAFFLNRYSLPLYQITSSVLLEPENRYSSSSGTGALSQGDVFQGLGDVRSMQNIYNQQVVLGSSSVIEKTLKELGLEVSWYTRGRVTDREIYPDAPFTVEWDTSHIQPTGLEINIEPAPGGKIRVTADGEWIPLYDYRQNRVIRRIPSLGISRTIAPGERIGSENFSFTVLLKDDQDPAVYDNCYFVFNTLQSLVSRYKASLYVEMRSDQSSILDLAVTGGNIEKSKLFLDKLVEVYQRDNLERKNKNADRTIDFITGQLESVADSLTVSEDRKQQFQTRNQAFDLSQQSQQLLAQMAELDRERAALEDKNQYYTYLRDYIVRNRDLESIVAPSAMGINDPLLNNLLLELNKLVVEKSSFITIRNEEHPRLKTLNSKIESMKGTLIENAGNILAQSQLALSELNNRIRRVQSLINALPVTERNFVNIERKYKINNETYTFLLEKLSVAQIAKASNFPDSQLIEPASFKGQVSPKTRRNYMFALILGMFLPGAFIFLKEFLNNKVTSEEQIRKLTRFPVIGYIFDNTREYGSPSLVLDRPNSPASEPFRALRGKLNLITQPGEKPVIAFTSTLPDEGKTYNAFNIASSFALMKKRTVLVDLDLRNSRLRKVYNIASEEGVVSYIQGTSSLRDITFPSQHPFLSLVPAGRRPSDPGEMLADEKVISLLRELKETFDVVIIDNLPVGLVADLYHLRDEIDATVYVVRHGFTDLRALKTALAEVAVNRMKNVGIIINYIKHARKNLGYSYNYGYIYDYGDGYGYGNAGRQERNRVKAEDSTSSGERNSLFRRRWSWLLVIPAVAILAVPLYFLLRGNPAGETQRSKSRPSVTAVPPAETTLKEPSVQIAKDTLVPAGVNESVNAASVKDTTLREPSATVINDTPDTASRKGSVSALPGPVPPATAGTVSGPPRADLWYLIGGSFKYQQEADSFFEQMSAKGYHPVQLGKVGRYFLVALEGFPTQSEAQKALNHYFRSVRNADGYIFHFPE